MLSNHQILSFKHVLHFVVVCSSKLFTISNLAKLWMLKLFPLQLFANIIIHVTSIPIDSISTVQLTKNVANICTYTKIRMHMPHRHGALPYEKLASKRGQYLCEHFRIVLNLVWCIPLPKNATLCSISLLRLNVEGRVILMCCWTI